MIAQNVDILITVLPALIGAVSGSLGGNIISNWLKKRDENETVRKDLTKNILYSSKTSVQSFYGRLHNMKDRGGAEYMKSIKGNDEYYTISTLFPWEAFLHMIEYSCWREYIHKWNTFIQILGAY
jgi:hypothetical protein